MGCGRRWHAFAGGAPQKPREVQIWWAMSSSSFLTKLLRMLCNGGSMMRLRLSRTQSYA